MELEAGEVLCRRGGECACVGAFSLRGSHRASQGLTGNMEAKVRPFSRLRAICKGAGILHQSRVGKNGGMR